MKKFLLFLSLLSAMSSCDTTTKVRKGTIETILLPEAKNTSESDHEVLLTIDSRMYSSEAGLYPLIELFKNELRIITGITVETTQKRDNGADLIFEIDSTLSEEESIINISSTINVIGGSYGALTQAKTTLLQLVQKEGDVLKFPVLIIRDKPDAVYRGLMIDLARKWHDMSTIKKVIDMAAFFKINFLQLHFTDYQSYTLPSKQYSKLSTPSRHYSFDDLKEMEAYSQLRGVTIIPEIDIPGHSSPFVKMYPEIFAIDDTLSNPWIINMGKEEVYESMDYIIAEVLAIFKATPYFHIGGDEAIFTKVKEDLNVINYMEQHNIEEDVHELYRHFLVRMNDIVKKHNRQMCVWEGFRKEGKIEIPKDIIVFEFETNRYLPNDLVADGYTVVNTSWKPLYIVNQKKWEPKTIYNWNMWRWENWYDKAPSIIPIQVEKSPLVIGAQMCSWEQTQEVEIPSIRKRLPVFVERIWNAEQKISYDEVRRRMDELDDRLSLLIDDDRQDKVLDGHNFSKEME